MHNSNESVGFPLTESCLEDAGRLVGHLCRLQSQLYTGLAIVESPEAEATFVFARGAIVFVEEAVGESFAQALRREGHLDQASWSKAVMAATEHLSDCQDLVFASCCHELGLLPAETLADLVRERVRARVIRAMGWQDCEVTLAPLDEIPAVAAAWGMAPASDAYLGVRTFYADADVAAIASEAGPRYPKLVVKPMLVATWLGLDLQEGRLLEALSRGTHTTAEVVASAGLESLHAWQLVSVLALAHWITFTHAPADGSASADAASGPSEHSRIRSRPRAHEPPSRPVVRSPSTKPSAPPAPSVLPDPQPVRGSTQRVIRDDEPTVKVVDEDDPTVRVTRKAHSGPQPERHDQRVAVTRVPHASRATTDGSRAATQGSRAATQGSRAATQGSRAATQGSRAATQGSRAPGQGSRAATQGSRAPGQGRALDRLGRELKRRREPTGSQGPAPRAAPGPVASPSVDDYGKAHLRELVRRRMATTQAARADSGEMGEASLLSRGRSQLHQEAFGPAANTFAELSEKVPDKAIYRAYRYYAQLRANPAVEERDEVCAELRGLLRDFVSDHDHRAFAYHALGHVAFAQGDDLSATKAFRRAAEYDKRNKDAIRYLKILERRRATKSAEPQKIFGIEINRKPKG